MRTQTSRSPRSEVSIAGDVLVFIAVLLLIYFAFLTTRPVLVALVLAAALASLSFGLFAWMVRLLRGRRRLAAVLSVLILFLGVLAPFALFGTFAVKRLIAEGTELAHSIGRGGPLSIERLAPAFGPFAPWFERGAAQLQSKLMVAGPEIAAKLGTLVAAVGRGALRTGIGMFVAAVALYYFFLDGRKWRERIVRLVPLPPADTRRFFERFHRVCIAVFIGNLGTALVQALFATLGYVIFGAPAPLIWGAATVIAALLPLVGPALVWLPVALVIGVEHGWLRGGGMVLWGVLIVGTVDNVVRPMLTRRGLQLHPLLVFVAVFGGTLAFGFVGLFVGPLVMALLITVLDVYERHVNVSARQR